MLVDRLSINASVPIKFGVVNVPLMFRSPSTLKPSISYILMFVTSKVEDSAVKFVT